MGSSHFWKKNSCLYIIWLQRSNLTIFKSQNPPHKSSKEKTLNDTLFLPTEPDWNGNDCGHFIAICQLNGLSYIHAGIETFVCNEINTKYKTVRELPVLQNFAPLPPITIYNLTDSSMKHQEELLHTNETLVSTRHPWNFMPE